MYVCSIKTCKKRQQFKSATVQEREDNVTWTEVNKIIYMIGLRRLRHHNQLNDEVIDTFLAHICTQGKSTKGSCIPSPYIESFMGDEFN